MTDFSQCESRLPTKVFSHYAYGDPLPVYARYVGEHGDVIAADAITVWVRCERETGHSGKHVAHGPREWADPA